MINLNEALHYDNVCYVKMVVIDGQKLAAIHSADGTALTVVGDRDLAFATVSQHGLTPMCVH